MSTTLRALTLEDIAGVLHLSGRRGRCEQVYAKVDALGARDGRLQASDRAQRFVEETQEVERLYSSDTKAYPVGGRKQLKTINKDHSLAASGEIFLAANETR